MKTKQFILFAQWFIPILAAQAALQEQTPEHWMTVSAAICRGTIHENQSFQKPDRIAIYTQTGVSVQETFKGTFAETARLEHRGGQLRNRGEIYCDQPAFQKGDEYLLFLQVRENETLYALHAISSADPEYATLLAQLRTLPPSGTDVSDQTYPVDNSPYGTQTVGILPGTTGYASRFLSCDRGEPIEYLVDMDLLPSGISSNQAMTALSNAFAAWEAETSLKFKFIGHESFGMSPGDVNISDGRIRVQLHDSYGEIDNLSTTLGRGGRAYTYSNAWPTGGYGGKVGPHEFDLTTRGYLVLEHTKSSLSNPATLEEVLCHELGHVLSLGHSSETSGESNSTLAQAQMYAWIHGDGRGASLNSWDTSSILKFYPTNTPPYGYDRIIDAITKPSPQHAFSAGVNQVRVPAYDLQGGATVELLAENQYLGAGTFSLIGNTIFFTPGGAYGDNEASPGSYFANCFVRMSDGINKSPPVEIRVVSLNHDGNGDLLPNSWASDNGVSSPSNDPDEDGLSNYEEWLLDSDPNDPQSGLRVALDASSISWSTKPSELYQLQMSTNLTNGFSNLGNPQIATGTNDTLQIEQTADQTFYRVIRMP